MIAFFNRLSKEDYKIIKVIQMKINFSSRFMKFIGGRNLAFSLILLILIGTTIYIYHKISFVFQPLITIISTVLPSIILAFIAYYLFNPIVNLLERFKIKRIWSIILLILAITGLVTGGILITASIIERQITDLANAFPGYLQQMGKEYKRGFNIPFSVNIMIKGINGSSQH